MVPVGLHQVWKHCSCSFGPIFCADLKSWDALGLSLGNTDFNSLHRFCWIEVQRWARPLQKLEMLCIPFIIWVMLEDSGTFHPQCSD